MPIPFSEIYHPYHHAPAAASGPAARVRVSRAERQALHAVPPRSGRLRVLMVTPFFGDGGGVGTAAKELTLQLQSQQIEVEVLHWWPGFSAPLLIDHAARTIRLSSLKALLASGREYDLLHFQSAAYGRRVKGGLHALCQRYPVPVMYTIHALAAYCAEAMPAPGFANQLADQLEMMDKAQAIVLLTRDLLSLMGKHHPQYLARCHVIPNGTRQIGPCPALATAQQQARERFNPQQQYPLLLYLARIAREKGINELVRAMPELKRRHPDCKLIIAGGVANHAEALDHTTLLRAALHAHGLHEGRDFAFAGWVDGAPKTALLDLADMVVMPSYYEHMPLTALEAMARRKLVLLSDVVGVRHCFQTRSKARRSVLPICDGRNPQALVEAVGQALAAPQEMQAIAARGYRQVQRHYNWRKVARRWINLYQSHFVQGNLHEHLN
jgi:glycogen(starch) synthase